MASENKKDFNEMMRNNKDMPKIQIVKDEKDNKKNMAELHHQFTTMN